MFWRFGGYSNISTIDTLLDKQNLKLEDLLDESDLIQELKSHHTKLIEYLREDSHLHALLSYVIAPGPQIEEEEEQQAPSSPELKSERTGLFGRRVDENRTRDEEREKAEKKRLKYAYVSCEILSCETWSITESLMANLPYLVEFWDFLRKTPPLDPLQAGYFTKVNETLLDKKTEEMLDFIKSLPDIVPAMLQHVDCPMIMDLLLKIISLEKAEGGAGIVEWLYDQELIPKLLASLSPDSPASTQTSAGDFLKAIITISANAPQNEQSCIGPNALTRQLVSETCVNDLIHYMLQGGNPLTVGVGIVIEVIRKNNSDYDPENAQNVDAPPTNHDPIYLGTLLRSFGKHVPDFMDLILSSKHAVTMGDSTKLVERGTLKSAWGTRIEPLGFDRFKTCELMAELLHCSNMGLLNERGSEEFIKHKDAERETLRAQGAFTLAKQSDDSAVDVSATSSKFENAFNSSTSPSTEDLHTSNSGEEDGFEKVVATDAEERKSLSTGSDLVEGPLSPTKAKAGKLRPASQALSPTTADLDDTVRRLSLDDTDMTTGPDEIEHHRRLSSEDVKMEDLQPHPEDKPAPLFAKKSDPNKTPTAASPEPPASPRSSKVTTSDNSILSQLEGDSLQNTHDDSTLLLQQQKASLEDEPVVGDYLKIMFVEHHVVPTILNFFFRFPWNNFLHNVVYDVVQQVFNGPMDRGYNRFLAFDLFESGRITEEIIEGQIRNDTAQQKNNMRLGYMGHLTLVAEEVVKFGERQPKEILSPKVQDYIYGKPWEEYVTKTLAETRERDNAILGGFRPETGLGSRQAVLNAVSGGGGYGGGSGLITAGIAGNQQGLDSVDLSNHGSATTTTYGSSGNSILSGFGSSSDDDDEEMDDADDEDHHRINEQLALADAGPGAADEESNKPVPLLPPPPAPLNLGPSRARRLLEDRLNRHKQEAAQKDATSAETGSDSEDPFAVLDSKTTSKSTNPFAIDEEDEQDITTFGKREGASGTNRGQSGSGQNFVPGRGIASLFTSGPKSPRVINHFDDDTEESTSEDDVSDEDERPPLEARTSLERRPIDSDDDEEMGEMVAPTTEDSSNSSDEEVLSPTEKERLGKTFGAPSPDKQHPRFDARAPSSDSDDNEALVEIAMPTASKRKSTG